MPLNITEAGHLEEPQGTSGKPFRRIKGQQGLLEDRPGTQSDSILIPTLP